MNRVPLTHPTITELLPSRNDGRRISLHTLRGWIQRGVIAPNGARVKLKAHRIGGRWYSHVEYVREFLAATGAEAAELATP